MVAEGFKERLADNLSGRSLVGMGVVGLLVGVVGLVEILTGISPVGMGVVGLVVNLNGSSPVGMGVVGLVVNLNGSSLVGMGVVGLGVPIFEKFIILWIINFFVMIISSYLTFFKGHNINLNKKFMVYKTRLI